MKADPFVRKAESSFTLANFMRTQLFTALGVLRIGMDILFEQEGVSIDSITGHGGFFKTALVGQKMMASALHTPVATLKSAGEGGAWGIALLASYLISKRPDARRIPRPGCLPMRSERSSKRPKKRLKVQCIPETLQGRSRNQKATVEFLHSAAVK